MSIGTVPMKFRVSIDQDQCMACARCVENCSYGVFRMENGVVRVSPRHCVACHRCLAMCPRDAISIEERPVDYRSHPLWTTEVKEAIFNQARTGKIIVAGMGNALPYPVIFDRLVLDACQVTNPSIDPLREPMELRTYIGKKPSHLDLQTKAKRGCRTLVDPCSESQVRDPDHDRAHELWCNQPQCPDQPCKSGK